MSTNGLLSLEQVVLTHLAEAQDAYTKLLESCPGQRHQDDLREFEAAIRICKNEIALRVVQRDYQGTGVAAMLR